MKHSLAALALLAFAAASLQHLLLNLWSGTPELVASRWGLTRRFSGSTGADVLTAAEAWLTTVTGRAA